MNAPPITPKRYTPAGQLSRAGADRELDPNTVRRMVEEGAKNARMAWAGTAYGRMRLEGNLSDRQFAACHKWAELRRDYEAAIGARARKSAMAALDRVSGAEPDPDSHLGEKISQAARRKIAEYERADATIRALGRVEYTDFRGIVEAAGERKWAMRTEAGNIRVCANALLHLWKM